MQSRLQQHLLQAACFLRRVGDVSLVSGRVSSYSNVVGSLHCLPFALPLTGALPVLAVLGPYRHHAVDERACLTILLLLDAFHFLMLLLDLRSQGWCDTRGIA